MPRRPRDALNRTVRDGISGRDTRDARFLEIG
jgi:hypothetical protein